MNQEIKAKWVEALRSGKYRQGKNNLRNPDETFCCLGVLCDISGVGHWSGTYRYITSDEQVRGFCMPPDEVNECSGLDHMTQRHIAALNDQGKSFAEIADYIEREL